MIRKIVSRYNSLKLVHKLIFTFFLASIVPILFIQIFSYRQNTENMLRNMDELRLHHLSQTAEQVNLNLEMYSNLIYQIYRDEEIIADVKAMIDDTNQRKALAYNRIVNRMKGYRGSVAKIRCLSIVCADGNMVIYDFATDSSLNTIWQPYHNIMQIPPYREAIDQPGMVITDTMRFETGENKGRFFNISKRMFDFAHPNKGSIGTIILTIEESALDDICSNDNFEHTVSFIMNEDRLVISYPDEDFSGITINPDLTDEEFVAVSGYLRNRNIAISKYVDVSTGWVYCSAYDADYVLRGIVSTQWIQIVIAVITLTAAVFLILFLVRTLDGSVQSVVNGMQEVQKGNLDVVVPMQSFHEIGIIADNFNATTVQVKQLIEEISEVKEQQKEAEIRALEAQINPHFLYNTLDSINWMAIEKEEYEISKMLRDLGVILRYSINRSNEMVTMKELADWLEKYISLQQMRFNNAFICDIHIDEAIHDVKVYKLLLQPFVENAIIHGFREMEHGGILRIDASMTDNQTGIIVIIEDNGNGINTDLLKTFNNREEAICDDGRSIGLHNAFARLNMYYGENASWNVNSIVGMGTVVTIRLPMNDEKDVTDENINC